MPSIKYHVSCSMLHMLLDLHQRNAMQAVNYSIHCIGGLMVWQVGQLSSCMDA